MASTEPTDQPVRQPNPKESWELTIPVPPVGDGCGANPGALDPVYRLPFPKGVTLPNRPLSPDPTRKAGSDQVSTGDTE